ncbi:MAG TPA: hypothetical protein VLA34_00875, partial [Candidatus Krumholzibacterium sp.]|nr:hypothetical protein [Candidatus Krumholzibacterium sp.]
MLPLKTSVRLSSCLGILAFDVFRVRRKVTISNLERAFGDSMTSREIVKTGRKSYVNFAKSMVEFASLSKVSPDQLRSLVHLKGREHVDRALEAGRGIV